MSLIAVSFSITLNEIKWFCWIACKKRQKWWYIDKAKNLLILIDVFVAFVILKPFQIFRKINLSCILLLETFIKFELKTSHTITHIFSTRNTGIWGKKHQMLFHVSRYFHRNIWFHTSLCNGFSRYIFIVIMWILYCKIIDDVFTLIEKNIMCDYISSRDILCAKTWHSIDHFFAMTCSTIRSNNSQVDFISQLLKKNKGDFIILLRRCIVTLDPKIFILDLIYRNHIS